MITTTIQSLIWLLVVASGNSIGPGGSTEGPGASDPTERAVPEASGSDASPSSAEVVAGYVAAGYDPASINLEAIQEDLSEVPDEVVMADGDVIRGRITQQTEEDVVLEHPVFGELRIPRDRIVAIKRQAPRVQRPGFGELVTGAGVRPLSSARRAVVPPVGPVDGSAQVNSGSEETTEEETEPDGEPQDDAIGYEDIIDPAHWSFTLGAAFGYVQNVNDEVNVRLSAQAEHNSELARLRINSVYFLNRANGEIIDNDVEISSIQDWFFPESPLSIFAQGTYQWDEFELWEQRISGYLGPGYKLIDTPELKLDGRFGGGVTYEYGVPQLLPELLVSTEWNWQVDERQRISGNLSYAPDVTNTRQYRLSLNLEWNFRLQKEDGMSFYLGLRDEYQSIVPEGSTRNDLRMFGGIKYEF